MQKKECVIFWGSQSGTAETLANRLGRELRPSMANLVADLSDYDADTIAALPSSTLVIFVLSTFGEGDPSDNAAGLWDWLHKGQDAGLKLSGLRYAAFGLGNSNYKYYNRVVDRVDDILEKAGAQRLMPTARADAALDGNEEAFMLWKADLRSMMAEKLGITTNRNEVTFEPTIQITEDTSLSLIDLHDGTPISRGRTKDTIVPLSVVEARELYDPARGNCIHMELDISPYSEMRYRTGDHIAVYPINTTDEVEILLSALGQTSKSDIPLLITSESDMSGIPSPITIATLFKYYLEIGAPVTRDLVEGLIQFAPSKQAAATLEALGKEKTAFDELVSSNHITVGRLLGIAAPNTVWDKLPLAYLVEMLPRLQPRSYSISSSAVVSPKKLSITVGVDTADLRNGDSNNKIHGLASTYLHQLSADGRHAGPSYDLSGPGDILKNRKVFASIRRSKFKLPTLASTPIIMIATGTGIAPFRGFVEERAKLRAMGREIGKMVLVYGCRDPKQDYLYADEFAQVDGLEIMTAFSRVEGAPKEYVQDAVRRNADALRKLLVEEDANLYICGRAAMARGVRGSLEEVLSSQQEWDQERAGTWVESAKRGGKWLEDVWG